MFQIGHHSEQPDEISFHAALSGSCHLEQRIPTVYTDCLLSLSHLSFQIYCKSIIVLVFKWPLFY